MTAPVLTLVIGVPSTVPPSKLSTLTGVASYDGPYPGGPTGLGLGQTLFHYDTTYGGYVMADSPAPPAAANPLALPLARGDVVGSAGAKGWLLIDLTWQSLDNTRQTKRLTLRPQAGPGGVLDLTVDQAPLGYTTPQSLLDLIARTTAAATRAEAARGDLTGTRAQRRAYDTSVLSKQTTWYETDTLTQMTYWPGIAHTATDLGWRRPDTSNPDAAPVPPPPPDTGVY